MLTEHLATFLDECDEAGVRVPRAARRELVDYLACGKAEHGFALLRCSGCGAARTVAFSCKRRGFCPSCGGRRMCATAAHLVDHVFPAVPVRQWVLSLPMPLRFRLCWDGELCREVLSILLSSVFDFYREASGVPDARCGSVTLRQLFGSSLNANLHFHALVVDGVFAAEGTGFHPVAPPSTADVQRVVNAVRDRVERLLVRRGLAGNEGNSRDEDEDDAANAFLEASMAGRAALGTRAGAIPRWMRERAVRKLPPRCAAAEFYNLHAGVGIAAGDKSGLERLCRYVLRPPLARSRLTWTEHGNLRLRFKRPWDDGTDGLLMTPSQFLARLVAIIPPPRRNLIHYHGVFAPAAPGRSAIVPGRRGAQDSTRPVLLPPSASPKWLMRPTWIPWASLLHRVFGLDAFVCTNCGTRMTVHAVVQGVWATTRVLASLARPSRQQRLVCARGPPAAP